MANLLHAALVVLASIPIGAGCAFAQQAAFPGPSEPLHGGGGVTYADLVRLVVPGIVVSGGKYSGGEAIDVREIGGEAVEDLRPASAAPLRVAAVPVRSEGMDRTVLLLDFGAGRDSAGFAILALFDVADGPRLLDAANVAAGNGTFFSDPARLAVGPGNDLLVTRSTHSNSSQGYTTTALVLVRNDRLELIDTIFALDEKVCTHERTQRLGVRKGAGEPFADITATVTEQVAISGNECGDRAAPLPGVRTIAVTYRWSPAERRYLPDSDAFVVLARENEARL